MGILLDLKSLEKQIIQLKKDIIEGVHQGFIEGQDLLQGIMKFYIQKEVYDMYLNPKVYERTYDLKNNVTTKVEGTTIWVYVDDTGMDKTADGVTYPYRVLEGHSVHPYEFTPKDGSWADYMNERNWVEATKIEFINHMNQSQQFLEIVRRNIRRKINGG